MANFTSQEFQTNVEELVNRGYNRDRATQMVYGWLKPGIGKNPAGTVKDRAISHGSESLRKNLNYTL